MAWHPNDLASDQDLIAYERTILTQFNVDDWQARRQKALEDWLFPLLESQGFPPQRLRTRYAPSIVLGSTSSAITDKTSAAATSDGLDLASILAAASDAIYIGSPVPFRGISVRLHDNVSAVASNLTVTLWTDQWAAPLGISDGVTVSGKPFARGGAITWTLPGTTVLRSISTFGPAYWAKLQVSVTPTAGTLAGPWLVIRRSRLCAAVAFRTLALIMREAPISQDGPWREKAEWYEQEAERAWNRVRGSIGGEFDLDGDDAISEDESDQTAEEAGAGGWMLERM